MSQPQPYIPFIPIQGSLAPVNEYTAISGKVIDYSKDIRNDFNHTFLPTAFNDWLIECQTLPVLFEHKEHLQAGQTISFESNGSGLFVECVLFDTPIARDCKRLIDTGIIIGLSPCYVYHTNNEINPEEAIGGHREIRKVVEITEISLVIQPGSPGGLLDGIVKRDNNLEEYQLRLDAYFHVKNKLEVDEIREMVKKIWTDIYEGYLQRLRLGKSMRI